MLDELYDEIDKIDDQIVDLLNQRFDLCYEVNEYKKNNDLPFYDIDREMEVEDRLEPRSNYTNMINDIYRAIFKYENSLR